jgi:TolB-like protein/DNA-binding winged helix-turn-helix (wHTH) protein
MPDDSRILRIGEWRVDPDLDELSREGQTIRLEPRPMRLLLYLAAHAGRVVDVQQLLDEVWPNVIVTHGSVYQAIAQLRRILGDESEHPKYIENLPRRGYRLIAPVAPWDVRCATATDSNPAAQGLTHVTNGSVAAEPQLTSEAPEAAATAVIPDSTAAPTPRSSVAPVWWSKLAFGAVGAVLAAALAYLAIDTFRISKPLQITSRTAPAIEKAAQSTSVTVEPVNKAFNPSPHSIAVLPFVNLSGDKEQEYFSDGLTEELLNSLAHIDGLQVAARTSSFSFREHPDIAYVAHKLNVASVLEGSVRRSGRTIRVTAQLNNALTGFHIWSQTYDRDLGDVLKLQTDIANAVAGALRIRLLGDEAAKIEVGGTHNPGAFDAYLRASKTFWEQLDEKGLQLAIDGYTEAIRLDPDYALAYAARSIAVQSLAQFGSSYWTSTPSERRAVNEKAHADARKAIALVPDLSEGYLALAMAYRWELDFKSASGACERALALGPGNARVLRDCGVLDVMTGHSDSGLRSLYRALALDPLNPFSHSFLGDALLDLRRYPEALAAYKDAGALAPSRVDMSAFIGIVYYLLGDFESARSFCETKPERPIYRSCLTMTYDKLGRHADAEAILAKIRASYGDAPAWWYSLMYAQRGDTARALDWLEAAMRTRDPFLDLKDPLLDPLRKEPRFQAIERALKFPD